MTPRVPAMPQAPEMVLLPCPFCGTQPRIYSGTRESPFKICCASFDCFGPHTTAASFGDAAVQWNTRAPVQSLSLSDGWQLVPRRPNEKMTAAGVVAQMEASSLGDALATAVYVAMLGAAPYRVVPDGWQLVPKQPDETMWQAGRSADVNPGDSYTKVYCAMLSVAPALPATPAAAGESDEAAERRLLNEEAADNLRLIDWIADKIGLPKNEELSRDNFSAWLAALSAPECRAGEREQAAHVLIKTRAFLKNYQRSNANWHNDTPTWNFIHDVLNPAIEALSASPPPSPERGWQVPERWQLVPKRADANMVTATVKLASHEFRDGVSRANFSEEYVAALAAAPLVAEPGEPTHD